MASGLPVAAFPVPVPLDIVDVVGVGALSEDLGAAVGEAIKLPRACPQILLDRLRRDFPGEP